MIILCILVIISLIHSLEFHSKLKFLWGIKKNLIQMLFFSFFIRIVIDSFLEISLVFTMEIQTYSSSKGRSLLIGLAALLYFVYIILIIISLLLGFLKSRILSLKFSTVYDGLYLKYNFWLFVYYTHYFLVRVILCVFIGVTPKAPSIALWAIFIVF